MVSKAVRIQLQALWLWALGTGRGEHQGRRSTTAWPEASARAVPGSGPRLPLTLHVPPPSPDTAHQLYSGSSRRDGGTGQ